MLINGNIPGLPPMGIISLKHSMISILLEVEAHDDETHFHERVRRPTTPSTTD